MAQIEASPRDNSPKSRRRWFQISLRTLVVVTTIIAIFLGWWSHKARQQRLAVAALKGKDGAVRYDLRLPWTDWMSNPPQWPTWLVDNLGVDYFGSVNRLVCSREVTDAGLEHLKGLAELQGLGIGETHVTDAGLEHLKGLEALQYLHVDRTQVTDAGLEHLKGLTALKELDLSKTHITAAGLEHLKGLKALRALYLYNTQVTNAEVAQLRKALPKCMIARVP